MLTALNRTGVALLTNKSGGTRNFGDVVIVDSANALAFTTTTTGSFADRIVGVVLEPNGIANDAKGLVAVSGWVPKINLNSAASIGQLLRTHTVAGQAAPHSPPQVSGDFGIALQASATPEAFLFGTLSPPQTGTIQVILGTGTAVITTGVKGDIEIPVSCKIQQVTMLADQSGSIVVDIWKDTYANYPPTVADSITAAAKPTISTATKSQDSTLTGWTTQINAGDTLRFNVDSVTNLQRVVMSLKVIKN